MPHADDTTTTDHRGALLRARVGATVGLTGGAVFVLVNRGGLPGPWPGVALAAWFALVVAAVWTVYLRAGRRVVEGPQHPRAGLIYAASVVGMLAFMAIVNGALRAAGHEEASPTVIVLAVGAHFIPFARAFGTPFFGLLGAVMSAIGAVGLVAALAWTHTAAAVTAVLAGLVMTGLVAAHATRG